VAPTRTWADDVAIVEYVARVGVMRGFDLGAGTPTLYLSELVDPPVREGGAQGPPLRSVGATPARALQRLEQRLVQRTAKVAHLRAVVGATEAPEPPAGAPVRRPGQRSIPVGRAARPAPP
jgi:hypothetical protein